MQRIAQKNAVAKMPEAELNRSLHEFMVPVRELLPDVRLGRVAELMTRGIVTSQSPIVTQIARGAGHADKTIWPVCQRAYRFLDNERISYRMLRKGLYRMAQAVVKGCAPQRLVIAVDPVNFEKPYTHKLEGVSTVMKRTPPTLNGEKRLTRGYPAITARVVNLPQPVITYANWLSYTSADFISQNWELMHAFRMSRALFSSQQVRFVGDAGLDDQKLFSYIEQLRAEFVIRANHNRLVDIYNTRLQRWETEKLVDLVHSVPFAFEQDVLFTHARRTRVARIHFASFQIRLPNTALLLWVLVAHHGDRDHDLILITNVPLDQTDSVREVYTDWRQRSYIEHGYRFDQEDGLDVEDVRVETLERMRRLYMLVLLAAQYICAVARSWPPAALIWLRTLGGKLGIKSDRDGLYLLLRGIGAVWQSVATLAFAANNPFSRDFPNM